jgi:hypothetical protein
MSVLSGFIIFVWPQRQFVRVEYFHRIVFAGNMKENSFPYSL